MALLSNHFVHDTGNIKYSYGQMMVATRVQLGADAGHDSKNMYSGVMQAYPAPTSVWVTFQKMPILGPQVFWSGAVFGFTTT